MIEKIYNLTNANGVIIGFDNGKLLSLPNILLAKIKNIFCQQLKNVKRAYIPEEDISKEITLNKVYEIRGGNGKYYLLFTEDEKECEIMISPEELKNLLNCLEETQASRIPWSEN